MTFARVFWPVVFVAALAACSGNLGGGQSTLPGAPTTGTNVQQVASATATATPVSASNVATLDSTAPQALPPIMGWGGTIGFPKPVAAPSPKTTSTPADDDGSTGPVSIGVTAAVVEPSDAPHFNSASAKRHSKPSGPSALLFISLLATSDVTLGEYPKIAVDMPRDIASKHRDDTFALALFDPETKEKAYKLGVAERDMSSPVPGSTPTPMATQKPSPSPTPAGPGFGPNGPGSLTPPPVGSSLGSGSLPPERVAFLGTALTLSLKANRPVVFALYAVPPSPTPTPSPTPRPTPHKSTSPEPASSANSVESSSPAAATPAATTSPKSTVF